MTGARLHVLPPLPPVLHLQRRPRPPSFPLGEPNCRLFSRARHGLWHGVRALGLGSGDEVLVPAYHHGSEVQALLEAGLQIVFYELTEMLEPDEAELGRLRGRRVRALHLTHFLGFPQDARRWRTWCDERGLLLIEDAAQAWLSERDGCPVGSVGDCSIYCLYKTYGLPDGAALLTTRPPEQPDPKGSSGAVALARRHGAWLAQRWQWLALLHADSTRMPYDPIEDFALGDPDAGPAQATLRLAARLDGGAAAARRRNYRYLLGELLDQVPGPFRNLPDGASPFVFPVVTGDPQATLGLLRTAGVAGLDLWAVPHPSLPHDRFPRAEWLRRSVIGVPVHQELTPADLDHIVAALRQSWPRGRGMTGGLLWSGRRTPRLGR